MKKSFGVSLAAATLLAGDFFAMDLAGGKLTGDVRAHYYAEDDGTKNESALGAGINPVFAIEAASGFTLEIGAGIAVPVAESVKDQAAAYGHAKAPDTPGDGSQMYSTLTKANVAYDFGRGFVKAGYQEFDTPLSGSDDIRLVPNSFMAIAAGYKGVKNLALTVVQITEMAGLVDGNADDAERYNSMSDQTFVDFDNNVTNSNIDDRSLTVVSAVYENEDVGANGQLWYYTMAEPRAGFGTVSAMYLDAGKSFGSVNISAQYITYKTDLQSNSATGVMAEAGFGDVGVTVAMNSYSFTDDGIGSMAAPAYYAWGGYPEYVSGQEVDSSGADWDGGNSYMVGVSCGGVKDLGLSATYLSYSDSVNATDIVAEYSINEQALVMFIYETKKYDDKITDDVNTMEAKAFYHF